MDRSRRKGSLHAFERTGKRLRGIERTLMKVAAFRDAKASNGKHKDWRVGLEPFFYNA